jgi:hypothetical protein
VCSKCGRLLVKTSNSGTLQDSSTLLILLAGFVLARVDVDLKYQYIYGSSSYTYMHCLFNNIYARYI